MGSKWVWVLVFVSLAWCSSQGCLDEERVALLQLKHFFNGGRYHTLSDWVDGEKNSDCCQWGRVECSSNISRVTSLDLWSTRDEHSRELYLNASLFSVFEELVWLDLSGNNIAGFVENEGLYKLSRSSKLKSLVLGFNMFSNDILSFLSALSSLEVLDLSYNKLKGRFDIQSIAFHNKLQDLNLENNEIEEVILPKGLDKLSGLSNLEYFYLGSNKLNNDILSSLNALPSLKWISLSNNSLKGTINLQDLDSCKKLQTLWLDSNEIEKVLFHKGLNNLERLDLSSNNLGNSILSYIGALSLLKKLYLYDIGLKGIVDISELHSLNNLEILNMGNNKIDKFIFSKDNTSLRNLSNLYLKNISIQDGNNLVQVLGSFPSLETLDLSYNNFNETMTTGDFPHLKKTKHLKELHMDHTNLHITFLQIIGMLTSSSLEKLTLSNCELQGTISHQGFPHLKNTMNLKRLYMDDTNLNITFNQITGLLTSASLEVLSLSNCGLQATLSHQDGGTLAEFLYHQHNLQVIDLSSNNLTEEFPNWLLENHSRLYHLNLANNSLGGRFQLPTHSQLNLTSLDISKNLFCGHIPKEIGGYLPSLTFLNLSKNYFDGSIPSSIGDMNSLEVLDLSYNQMSGKIPKHLVEGCPFLRFLLLSNNSLQGQMFSSNFNLTNLQRLQLDGNNFTGKIPDSLSNASNLRGLYLSDNNLLGRLPGWLGNMSSLEDIIMPNNHLEGSIPSEFCQLEYLTILNLANNNLSGCLPYCFSSPIIEQIHLSKNSFQGQLSDFLVNSSFLVTLDLSYNQLHGSIPTWINLNFKLKYLILRNNSLSGELPTQLCQLNQLRLIDFSHNNLSGHIPPCLELTALHDDHNGDVDIDSTYIYGLNLYGDRPIQIRNEEIVEFTTKTSSYFYEGKVLTYMSGIDLSCNKLIGLIPQQVGNLTRIHTLNLSHNNLTGPIPLTFSKLKQIESLDLSYNNLNGKIPSQLVELNFLISFSVAHNNLSGKTPDRIAQFGTFEENCYVGNPLLCGQPLNKSCDITKSPPSMPEAPVENDKDSDFIDIDIFYMSFMGSYIIILIAIGAVLYINPYWRRTWFYLIEIWMISFYYFVVDNLPW